MGDRVSDVPRIVCVAGMHRCGTSLVSRVVNLLGVDLGPGEELMDPRPDNPEGFWENRSITAVNDDLLAELGGRWDTPPRLKDDWENDQVLDEYRERARLLIRELFGGTEMAGWKDPRMSLLLPFWRTVVEIDRTVVAIRDPRAAAASLKQRDGLEEERSADLWLRYVTAAWKNGRNPHFVTYEDLLEDLDATTSSLARFLGLPEPSAETLDLLHQTAKPELRHHLGRTEPESQLMRLAMHLFDLIRAGENFALGALAVELGRRWAAESEVEDRARQLDDLTLLAEAKVEQLEAERRRLRASEEQREGVKAQLEAVTSSLGWQVYQRLAKKLRKPGTKREKLVLRLRRPTRSAFIRMGMFSEPPPATRAQPALERDFTSVILPHVDHPVASIVVPVHDQAVFTYNCLRSLAETNGEVPFEVIVVDDCSGPETTSMLETIQNLRVVRNVENQGFLRSTNRGAGAARGTFLVFLNNDTIVQDGWLDTLVATASEAPDIGMVGAKLVFSDGRLQDAGGIMFTDATGVNYGKWGDPDHPAYNFVRDTDYCSAACSLVRKDVFDELGGFDERYVPAYYEDTDLAFAVRKSGYRVLYEPAAEVVHFEGASHGTDLGQGIKAHELINRKTFVAKWEETLLKEHLPPGSDPLVASRRPPRDVVVIADHHVPTYDQDSGSRRMFELIKLMRSLGKHVVFLPADLDRKQPYTRDLQHLGVEVLYEGVDPFEHLQRLAPVVTTCVVSRISTALTHLDLLRESLPDAAFVFDTVDLSFVRESRRLEIGGGGSRGAIERLKKRELKVIKEVEQTWVVTPEERDLVMQAVPSSHAVVIPNVHDEEVTTTPFRERAGLLFIGSFLHPPNSAAVLYFVNEILPLIQEEVPGVHLYVVGTRPGEEVRSLASDTVTVTGWVKDVRPYLYSCRVAVAPLTYGAGLKGKVGQTMGCGLATVMTSIGAEGLGVTDGAEAFVADDPAEFAAKVVQVYQDEELWVSMSRKGAEHIRSRFSSEAVRRMLQEALPGRISVAKTGAP